MNYQYARIAEAARLLHERLPSLDNPADILKAVELKALYAEISTLPPGQRAGFGKEINSLKAELEQSVADRAEQSNMLPAIDVTAPFDVNSAPNRRPRMLRADAGSSHPLTTEIGVLADIFYRMGFTVAESRELDSEYHMFSALNFPAGHPARDDYDTFMTAETDQNQHPFVAPAHTSTMQHRILKKYKAGLERGEAIGVVIPDRVFRNEDVDARHEHTFYQIEGIYVAKGVHAGNLVATVRAFLQEYYQRELKVKIQPFYFPFTEPSFEFAASCPFCAEEGCNICSYSGWMELGGCGMVHPNVLREAGINPEVYTGFAWGFGIDRLVMLKYNIEDIRHFHSAKLDFLKQFS